MGTKIDRAFDIVVRETAVAEHTERFAGGHPGLYGALIVLASVAAWQWIGVWAALGLGVGVTLMRSAFVTPPKKLSTVTRETRVEITDEGISAVGERFIRRDEIAQAYFQPRGEARPTVRCVDRHHAVLFETEVEDEDEAEEVLAALGHDAGHARSEFRVAAPHLNGAFGSAASMFIALGLFVLAAVASGQGGWWAGGAVFATLVGFIASLNFQQHVEVGIDGVLVRWLSRRRFIPFDAIESLAITHSGRCVELYLRGGQSARAGEVVRLWTPSARQPQREAARDMGALAARIHEASRAHERSEGAKELAASVARGERAVKEWRAELDRLHDPETRGGYRTPGARGEDLWRVVEDTTAPEDARAGAAIALRKEDGAHPRLRVAAEAVASPKLRIALERAADPAAEDAALDEALEAFAEEKA